MEQTHQLALSARSTGPCWRSIGVVLVVGTALFMWSDRAHDWRYYQYAFRQQVAEKFGADKAADVPTGLQQIWVADLGRADRCITCHQGVSWKGFESAEEPYRTHPVEPLEDASDREVRLHVVSRRTGLGGGHVGRARRGRALGGAAAQPHARRELHAGDRQERADADELQHVPPLRPRDEGRRARSTSPSSSCRRRDAARATSINGYGGTIGPDLTRGRRQGARAVRLQPALRAADRVRLARRALQGPARARRRTRSCPTSTSRPKQAQALAMLVLSWRGRVVPAAYLAGAPRTDPRTRGGAEGRGPR